MGGYEGSGGAQLSVGAKQPGPEHGSALPERFDAVDAKQLAPTHSARVQSSFLMSFVMLGSFRLVPTGRLTGMTTSALHLGKLENHLALGVTIVRFAGLRNHFP
jgi:hypothetical protein